MHEIQRKLEVIVVDVREALTAQEAGADRIELVADMSRGGLSPDERTVAAVLEAVKIDVRVMVRPHDDGFVYDPQSRAAIVQTAARFRELGARGIVFGALTPSGEIDEALLTGVIAAADGAALTFHRAFDHSADLRAAYATLGRFQAITHVLTSGGANDVDDGADVLRELIALQSEPEVLIGGGVSVENLRELLRRTGAREVHAGRAARAGDRIDASKIAKLRAVLG